MQHAIILIYVAVACLVASVFYYYIPIFPLAACIVISCVGALISYWVILEYSPMFVQRNMFGRDQCKASTNPVPEPVGILTAAVYLILMFIFIPFPFYEWIQNHSLFPHDRFMAFLSALLGICTAILLGFTDDVLDLRWRHKLLLSAFSSLPVLLVYYVTGSSTIVVVPNQLQTVLPFGTTIDIGILYYIYMGMMIVFCTHSINILAGINGLEVGQALVIALSIIMFNVVQLLRLGAETWHHCLSLYFLVPFVAVNSVLLYFNWYPARVFVGDTFCYWAGMTLGSMCILGHFSKTMALFLVPQVFNFLYSVPQLFHLLPCPRHRLPKFDPETNTVGLSFAEFEIKSLKLPGSLVLRLFSKFGIIFWQEFQKNGERWVRINNLTLLNLVLKFCGRMHESRLTLILLAVQMLSSCVAFFIRFFLARFFYDVVY